MAQLESTQALEFQECPLQNPTQAQQVLLPQVQQQAEQQEQQLAQLESTQALEFQEYPLQNPTQAQQVSLPQAQQQAVQQEQQTVHPIPKHPIQQPQVQ